MPLTNSTDLVTDARELYDDAFNGDAEMGDLIRMLPKLASALEESRASEKQLKGYCSEHILRTDELKRKLTSAQAELRVVIVQRDAARGRHSVTLTRIEEARAELERLRVGHIEPSPFTLNPEHATMGYVCILAQYNGDQDGWDLHDDGKHYGWILASLEEPTP